MRRPYSSRIVFCGADSQATFAASVPSRLRIRIRGGGALSVK